MRTIATLLLIFAQFTHQGLAQETIRIGLSIASDSNERFDGIIFGTDQRATLGLDTALGERDYPGYPPKQLHAFVSIIDPQTGEEYYSYKNFKPFPNDVHKYYTEYKIEVNPYAGDTITVTWGTLPDDVDSAYFTKPYAGSDLFSINMKENSSYSFNIRDFGFPMNALFKVWFSRKINALADAAESSKTITLLPNPANDVLRLRNVLDKSSYKIYNILGEVAGQGRLYGERDQINIQNFQTGYYFIKIVDNYGNQQNRSFLKK